MTASETERAEFLHKLGLGTPFTEEDVRQAYRAKARHLHPDAGGDAHQLQSLRAAHDQALEYLSFRGNRREWIARMVDEQLRRDSLETRLEALGVEVESDENEWQKRSFGDFAQLSQSFHALRLRPTTQISAAVDLLQSAAEEFREVRLLDAAGAALTDELLKRLTCLPRLIRLDLRRTQVTLQGLAILDQFPWLEDLHLGQTRVSWFGRWSLQRRYPELTITTNAQTHFDARPRQVTAGLGL